eukprot:CAMPEP_0168745386 /NCGR_PEP_ID=MMETSP0724-20121128/14585_1 /TAXON_ID=265536 /ORGANISM="Amphiprora sp., Strain CCMP467" /LENGTH=572 /DNA_ID=CAMNT_0008793085 /DNA_START=79 /DNA_END=1797 /DNA_ORIENTATION=-
MSPPGSKCHKVHFSLPSLSGSFRPSEKGSSFFRRATGQPDPKTGLAASTSTVTDRSTSTSSCRHHEQAERVHRQYIYDRIHGNSYVPRWQRNKDDKNKAALSQSSFSDYDLQANVGEDEGAEDMTSWTNRPPHFLCYLPPCVGRWPRFMEQNDFCEWMGKIGFHKYFKYNHERRRKVFAVGFFFNFVSLCLMVVACMAFSTDHSVLTNTSFARGFMRAAVPDSDETLSIRADVGFRAVATSDAMGWFGGDDVIRFFPLCREDFDAVVLQEAICGECQASSNMFVASCLINLIIILKNMFSDVTRMYPRYDLNCPNFAGSIMSLMSVFLGLYTIWTYRGRCLENMTEERDSIGFDQQFSSLPDYISEKLQQTDTLQVDIDWQAGPGLKCLVVATFLRILDTICNFMVPTPSITRGAVEQERYELEFAHMSEEERLRRSRRLEMRLSQLRIDLPEEEENEDLEPFSVPIIRTRSNFDREVVDVDEPEVVPEPIKTLNREERPLTDEIVDVDVDHDAGHARVAGEEIEDESELGGNGWLESVSNRFPAEVDHAETLPKDEEKGTRRPDRSLKRQT